MIVICLILNASMSHNVLCLIELVAMLSLCRICGQQSLKELLSMSVLVSACSLLMLCCDVLAAFRAIANEKSENCNLTANFTFYCVS